MITGKPVRRDYYRLSNQHILGNFKKLQPAGNSKESFGKGIILIFIRIFMVRVQRVRFLSLLQKKCRYLSSVEIPSIFLSWRGNCEDDPLSPPVGEAAQGDKPLDPNERLDFLLKLPKYDPQPCSTGRTPTRR